jgi:hypothetical protein
MTALAILAGLMALAAGSVALGQHFWIRNFRADCVADLLRLQQYLIAAEAAEQDLIGELIKARAELAYYRGRVSAPAVNGVVAGEAEDEP